VTDPQDLLQGQGRVPGPRAVPLLAEVRTQSTLPFHSVSAPNWSNPGPFGVAHEWACTMSWDQIYKLQQFLKANVAPTTSTPEALIDAEMRGLNIGFYLGTFIGQGHGGAAVRMLFAYTSSMAVEDIAKVWSTLLTAPTPAQRPAADAITALRRMWSAGTDKTEAGLMLLTQVDLDAELGDAEQFPFGSVDKP
jgi:hypothetical protein